MPDVKEYIATITSKGQVTIPAKVREQLGLGTQDKVIFRVLADNRVEIEPLPMTLEEAYGSVPPLGRPEDLRPLRDLTRAERAEPWLQRADK